MPRAMSATGQEMVDMLPLALRDDPVLKAVYDVTGQEFDLLDSYIDKVLANATVSTASDWLFLQEMSLGIAQADPTQTVAQRRTTAEAWLALMTSDGSGASWASNVTFLIGANWTYKLHNPADPSSPPAHTVYVYIPYAAGSAYATRFEALLRAITPANMVILVTYSQGFILDVSTLDHSLL